MEYHPTDHGSSEEAQVADPPRYPNSREEAGMPRWVMVLGIVVAVVVLLVVATMFIGGGGHSPRRHGGAGGEVPSAKMAEEALSDGVVADMIAQTIDLVCQLRLGPDGRRGHCCILRSAPLMASTGTPERS